MKKLLTITAMALVSTVAPAATIIVDDFGQNQNLLVNAGTTHAEGGVAAADAIGGARFASLDFVGGSSGQDNQLQINTAVANQLVFSNGTTSNSQFTLLWDGDTNSTNDFGLASDLTDTGLNDRIRLYFASSDHQVINGGVLTVYKDATNYSTATFNIPLIGLDAPDVDLLFAAFVNTGTGADFTNAKAIRLDVTGVNALDMQLDFVEATNAGVPEPATFAIFGAGLAALGLLRRRAKK